jgi:hypothetical protein
VPKVNFMIWWSLKLWESRNWTAGRETGKSVNLRDAFSSLLPPCQLILKAIKRKLCIVVIITHMWNIENLVMHMMFQTVSLHYIYISHIILHIYTYIYMCVCSTELFYTTLRSHFPVHHLGLGEIVPGSPATQSPGSHLFLGSWVQ